MTREQEKTEREREAAALYGPPDREKQRRRVQCRRGLGERRQWSQAGALLAMGRCGYSTGNPNSAGPEGGQKQKGKRYGRYGTGTVHRAPEVGAVELGGRLRLQR